MKFKDFFIERQVFALNTGEQSQVDQLTAKYVNEMQKLSPKDIKKTTEPLDKSIYDRLNVSSLNNAKPRYDFLGVINIKDRSTEEERAINVFVIFNVDSNASGVYYDEEGEIFLFHDILKYESSRYVHEILTHETIHAVQHYKKMSTAYSRAVAAKRFGPKSKTAYYTEPMEREATIGGLVAQILKTFNDHLNNINNEIKNKKSENVIRYYLIKLETFLKSIEVFAKTPPENYLKYKELPLPAPISHRYEFFSVLSENPKLRREYQKKIISLSNQMMEKANVFLKKHNLSFTYANR